MLRISNSRTHIDVEKLRCFLQEESYWAQTRTLEQIEVSIENSLCFVLLKDEVMIGFARVVTDYGVFAYLADVFIDKDQRGQGYGKHLMEAVFSHPDLQLIYRWMLGTLDAHELYRKYGFKEVAEPKRWMEFLPKGSELS